MRKIKESKALRRLEIYANTLMLIGMFTVAMSFWVYALTEWVLVLFVLVLGIIISIIGGKIWQVITTS